MGVEELHGLVDGHVQHVGDRLTLEAHLQRLAVVALSAAYLARYVHIGHEVHLYGLVAVACALFAAAAFGVEGEASCAPSAYLRLRQLCEQFAYVVEDVGIGGRVAAGRTSDRRLIDVDHLVDSLHSFDGLVGKRLCLAAVEPLTQDRIERLVDERALAASAHACHAYHPPERNTYRHILQVIARAPA